MSNIPNYVNQVQSVEQKLTTMWGSVQEGWQDCVAEGFNEGVMEPYFKNFPHYLTGEGVKGYGLEQLLSLMDKHLQDMSLLIDD